MGRKGLFNAAVLRKEIAEQIDAFEQLSVGDLGEFGIPLMELAEAVS